MIRLFLDTSYKYLTCILFDEERILSSYSEVCFKHQSELLFVALEKIFQEAGISKKDIDAVCITEGPGSYTGVRIAMSVAKTLCDLRNIDLYTISTLRLYANRQKDTMVIMNARADRAYVGLYDGDEVVEDDHIVVLSESDLSGHTMVGDLSLFGKEDIYPDIAEAFLNCQPLMTKVENLAHLVPKYLKESESYYR